MTFDLFTSITRGLFEKDKTIFAFLLGCRINQREGKIRPEEWGVYINGKVYSDIYLSDPLNTAQITPLGKSMLEGLEK